MATMPTTLRTAYACPGCGSPIDIVAQLHVDADSLIATLDPEQLRAAVAAHVATRHADPQPPLEG